MEKNREKGASEQEEQAFKKLLGQYLVPPPSPDQHRAVLDHALKAYERQSESMTASLIRQMKLELDYLSLWYYLLSTLVALVGIALIVFSPRERLPYLSMMMAISPLPVLMGLVEVFHGTDEGMGEIEAASRYSMPRILAGRLLVVGLISAPVCLIWGVLTSLKCNIPAIGWAITPYCLSAAAGMIFATLLKGRANTLQIAATLAVVNAFAAIAVGRAMHGPAAPLFQWGMLIGSLAAAAISVGYMLRHISGIEERSRELWN